MHDVLAHRVSLLSLHAGALEFHPDASAEEVAEAAGVIRASAHAALEELRDVIGVLREGRRRARPSRRSPRSPRSPPSSRSRGGRDARALHARRAAARRSPPPLGRAAYRIVQEGLTNARKHAPGAAVEVTISAEAARALVVEVVSRRAVGVGAPAPLALPGAGTGLVGLAERVALAGGELDHGPDAAATSSCARRCRGRRDATVRVLLVDDDALVRSGLRMMLAGAERIEVVGEADDGRGVLAAVDRHRPDVVLMDIRMPQLDGIAATRLLRAQPDPPAVVVLTTFDADELVLRALRAGAAGFLLKDTPPAEIVRAIELVDAGDGMLSPDRHPPAHRARRRRGRRRARATTAPRELLAALSAREREVALAVGRGLANADIAAELHMSVATVKAHVSRLLEKLGVDNRVQIALLVQDATDASR